MKTLTCESFAALRLGHTASDAFALEHFASASLDVEKFVLDEANRNLYVQWGDRFIYHSDLPKIADWAGVSLGDVVIYTRTNTAAVSIRNIPMSN